MSRPQDRMPDIKARAAAAAGRTTETEAEPEIGPGPSGVSPVSSPPQAPTAAEPDIIGTITDDQLAPIGDIPMVPVWLAWAEVRREVRAIGKTQLFDVKGAGKFNFRGADLVLNAFGPAMWRHGVNVIPERVEPTYRDLEREGKTPQRECSVVVTWRIYGPLGDYIVAQSAGEAMDTAGRATSKAQTVALRVLFLSAGTVPTADPETTADERGTARVADDETYRTEITNPNTSLSRLRQIRGELKGQGRFGLVNLVDQVGRSRTPKATPPAPAEPVASTGDAWKDAWNVLVNIGAQQGADEQAMKVAFAGWPDGPLCDPSDAGAEALTAFAAYLEGRSA